MKLKRHELKEFLDEKVELYNQPSFIMCDPISIPHQFTEKHDIEIAGFLAATIAWGNRKMILKNANRIMELLDHSPYEFIMNSSDDEFQGIGNFVHITFNSTDLFYFLKALRHIYKNKVDLKLFSALIKRLILFNLLYMNYTIFFLNFHMKRERKGMYLIHIKDHRQRN